MNQPSKAEQRLIRAMVKRGRKAFRVLRSPETRIKTYERGVRP